MSNVPALSYSVLLAYTDEETRRWRAYFDQNPKALDVPIGGERKDVRGLVTHLFVSEYRWGQHLAGEHPASPDSFKPQNIDEIWAIYATARKRLETWVAGATPEDLAQILTVKSVTYGETVVSKRKILTHALIHGIRHWAQIATALRQGCFVSGWSHDMLFTPAMR
jgi:uncharacterized damage-inducible protein DinB